MSSSSSLSGARRRRAGGGSGPTSTSAPPPVPQRTASGLKSATPQPTQNNSNPFQLLQQHEAKLNMLRETLQQVLSEKNDNSNNQQASGSINMEAIQEKINIDVENVSNFVMERVEKDLDLKAFYDNDEKLMNEIESLKVTLHSQQMVINGLSTALYSVVSKLNLAIPDLGENELNVSEETSVEADEQAIKEAEEQAIEEAIEAVIEEEGDETVDKEVTPTFPKSVSIVEGDNTTMEFYPMEGNDDEDDDNYGLVNPPVD
jgi:hypothetical protein